MSKRIGESTIMPDNDIIISSFAAVGGIKEGQGPYGGCYDYIDKDDRFGQESFEDAENAMQGLALQTALDKRKIPGSELSMMFGGDLLNQCVSSAFAMKDSKAPYFGMYGACSTMAESLSLASMVIDGGFATKTCALTGSHFCSAERQFRFPLEYGGQRTPTSQWTVTGAGAVILAAGGQGPKVTHVTTGMIVDAGIKDANSMGSAMAPAAYETLNAHFTETGRSPDYYDAIFTGDLGAQGHDILQALFLADGVELDARYMDCGVLMFDLNTQNVGCGGSGCGCCASVLGGHILKAMNNGVWQRVLVAATGALMSPTSAQQGASIPGICHAVAIESGV